jgi:hypothetical protein
MLRACIGHELLTFFESTSIRIIFLSSTSAVVDHFTQYIGWDSCEEIVEDLWGSILFHGRYTNDGLCATRRSALRTIDCPRDLRDRFFIEIIN